MPTAGRLMMRTLLIAVVGLVVGGSALGATDGILGSTSTGTVGISITKLDPVDVQDHAISWQPGDSSPSICVLSTDNYHVSATSDNTTGTDFRLSNGSTSILYTVVWIDGKLILTIPAEQAQAATGDAFTDTLTVMASPE
jgi:hypothetical protein